MRLLLLIALLVVAPVAADDPPVVRFRLKSNSSVQLRGRIVEFDHTRFVLQEFGRGAKRTLPWSDLAPTDRRRLRIRFGLELGDADRATRFVPAHEIRFKGGFVIEGLLVRVDEDGKHWVKRGGVTLPYPKDRIAKVRETELPETDVYDADEVYARRLLRDQPETADQHLDVAAYLYDIGNFEKARTHYETAAGLKPLVKTTVAPRLALIEEYLADARAAVVFRKAKRRGVLHGDHRGAIAMVEAFTAKNEEFERQGIRLVDEIRERQDARKARLFLRVKHEATDRAIRKYLATRKPSCQDAMAWIKSDLAKLVKSRVRARLDLSDGDYDVLLEKKPTRAAPHWATYKDGTFIISKRRATEANADSWWGRYGDAEAHVPFLKAYAAEQLPELFEVTRVNFTDCTRCGARGFVRKMAFRSTGGPGTNEWNELCPRCKGNKRDRGVAYR
ncbi:MAG: hypothetical protein OER88_07175 [Planctomycetota bacterium]|nr:hypothetical protein [Planctomycetota bacterium]